MARILTLGMCLVLFHVLAISEEVWLILGLELLIFIFMKELFRGEEKND
jgi:hypothetical protein